MSNQLSRDTLSGVETSIVALEAAIISRRSLLESFSRLNKLWNFFATIFQVFCKFARASVDLKKKNSLNSQQLA